MIGGDEASTGAPRRHRRRSPRAAPRPSPRRRPSDRACSAWAQSTTGGDGSLAVPWDRLGRERGREVELVSDADELGERRDAHLPHEVGAMKLDGALGRAELAGDLLVEEPTDDQGQDLPFAGGEPRVTLTEGVRFAPRLLRGPIVLERDSNRLEELRLAIRLGQKLDGPGPHGVHGHRNV